MTEDKYLTMKDAAQRFGMARQTLYKLRDQGRIQTKKMGLFRVISMKEVERFERATQTISLKGKRVRIFPEAKNVEVEVV